MRMPTHNFASTFRAFLAWRSGASAGICLPELSCVLGFGYWGMRSIRGAYPYEFVVKSETRFQNAHPVRVCTCFNGHVINYGYFRLQNRIINRGPVLVVRWNHLCIWTKAFFIHCLEVGNTGLVVTVSINCRLPIRRKVSDVHCTEWQFLERLALHLI